jgi:two-component system, OmpR family, response regulator
LRILLIEDDVVLGSAIRDHIGRTQNAVDWMETLGDGEAALETTDYGLVLLDLNLPDGNGITLLKNMRQRGDSISVLILTAQDRVQQRIDGLNAGADDYLVKPFDLHELSARINAVARRYVGKPNPTLHFGDLEINLTSRALRKGGQNIDLTAREWTIVEVLANHSGQIVSKSSLEESLYAFGSEIESNAIEVYVSRLRKKLGRDGIHTIRGLGYRLGETL